jgi:hypothetical protein
MRPSLIHKILRADKTSEAAEIRQAQQQLAARRSDIEARIRAIQPGDASNGGPGPDRRRVLETGSPDELVELDQELARLRAERDQQLPHQEVELRKRLDAALADEASARLPDRIRALPAVIESYREAEAAYQQARAAFDEAVTEIITDRAAAGDDAPTVDEHIVEQVAQVKGFKEDERPHAYSSNRARLFVQLTGETTPKARGVDAELRGRDRFAEDEHGDPELRRRHPESSIWRRREPGAPR